MNLEGNSSNTDPRILVFGDFNPYGSGFKIEKSPVNVRDFLDYMIEKEKEGFEYKSFDAICVSWDGDEESKSMDIHWTIKRLDDLLVPGGLFHWNFSRKPSSDEYFALRTTAFSLFGPAIQNGSIYRKGK